MPAPKDPNKYQEWITNISKGHIGQVCWMKGLTKETDERVRRIADAKRGKKRPDVSRMRKAAKGIPTGRVPWNKGKPMSEEIKKKISMHHKKNGVGKWMIGRPAYNKGKPGLKKELNPNWQGGITSIHQVIRQSLEYEEWRKAVFERDNYTCQGCRKIGGWLEADHIKPFSLYPELRFELSNGRTLCKPCHRKLGWNIFRENNPRKKKKDAPELPKYCDIPWVNPRPTHEE